MPQPLSSTVEEELDKSNSEFNPEILEAVLDDEQGAISSKQIRAMNQK
jgi:hypothetical protein